MAGAAVAWRARVAGLGVVVAAMASTARGEWVWVEGEKPVRQSMHRHPFWYDQVQRDQFSGKDFLSNFSEQPGEASYRVKVPKAGTYEFWVRVNPVQAKLKYKLGDGPWTPVALDGEQRDSVNVAADGKVDLRFLAWVRVGEVKLKKGDNLVGFRMDGTERNHGYLDCFVFTDEAFNPSGATKPGAAVAAEPGWFVFQPPPDPFAATGAIDLRALNEPEAGAGGFIGVKGGRFVHSKTGEPVRFWAVNGPPEGDRDQLRRTARMLAKYGVNLVRVHHGYFDKNGDVDSAAVRRALEVVEAMKAEGIYCHFSIYFPLWLDPAPDTPWLRGYDGKTKPFAALFFNDDFQEHYKTWWKALLTTPSPTTGRRLVDEPAVMGAEIINEDSYFFWTFKPEHIPDPQMRIIESRFGDWLAKRYGSIDAAFRAWGSGRIDRDDPAAGRVAFRPLWNIANERTRRDRDTARFLAESQRAFYEKMYRFLRELGFKGTITASNWTTASAEYFGPLEKYSYTATDFVDRHGYFGCRNRGEAAEWSIRDGQTFVDRSALRFDPEEPGRPKQFVHPAMDPHYGGKPSMISETTWNRPNRYRSEAPLFLAAYGALQGSDAIVHFALDGASWSTRPRFFMQPWTLMGPAMMAQFPAAALIYRKGLVAEGDVLARLDLKLGDLFDLNGTPLPQDAAFDELRAKDVPRGTTLRPGNIIDPLIHLAGRVEVDFGDRGAPAKLKNLSKLVDRKRQVVASATGQLRLDYGRGVLTIDAPSAQGVSGDLAAAGTVDLKDVSIASRLDLGHVVAVSLDGKALATSGKILVQAMSEEKASGFCADGPARGERRIASVGHDPWLVRDL
jgi:hypothetical protein